MSNTRLSEQKNRADEDHARNCIDRLCKYLDSENCKDQLIKFNGCNNFFSQVISTTVDFTILLDDAFQLLLEAPLLLGYSMPAGVIALILGIGVAAGSAYCHCALNKNSREKSTKEDDQKDQKVQKEVKVSWCDSRHSLLIFADWIGHMNEFAVPYTVLVECVSRYLSLSRKIQLPLDILCFFIAGIAALTDRETCKNAVEKYLTKQQKEAQDDNLYESIDEVGTKGSTNTENTDNPTDCCLRRRCCRSG